MIERPCSNGRSSSAGTPSSSVHVNVRPSIPVRVGVLGGGEAAAGKAELAQHVVERLLDDGAVAGLPRHGPRVQVGGGEEGVVVEHLLEVRHEPAVVDRVAVEAAADEVVHPAGRHAVQRRLHHRHGLGRPAAEEELERRGGWELRRPPEAAVGWVERARDPPLRLREQRSGERVGRRLQAGRVVDGIHQAPGLLADVVALRPPGLGHGEQELGERRHAMARLRGEVRPCIEGLAVRGQEHRHRPAALAGHRDGGIHVEGVDVGPFLTIDLDVDEVLVHQSRRGRALERLVRHHVAPVAGAVADREEDGPLLSPGALEGLGPPRVPVDGIPGVLEEVRAGLGREAVHGSSLPHDDPVERCGTPHERRTSPTPRSRVRRRDCAREESSEQSRGRPGGAGARRTGARVTSSARSARDTCVPARHVEGPGDLERRELEQRRGEVRHLHRRADLVLVEHGGGITRGQLVLRGRVIRAPHDQGRADEQSVRGSRDDTRLGVGLGTAVGRARRRRVLLHVRRTLAAVEDDVCREVDEAGADEGRRAGDVRGAVDDDLPRTLAVLPVGGVDHHRGPDALEERAHGAGIPDLDPFPARVRGEPEQLRAEEAGRARDVQLHDSASGAGVTESGGGFFSRRFLTNSITNAMVNASPSPTSTPFHGCSSNCLPPM